MILFLLLKNLNYNDKIVLYNIGGDKMEALFTFLANNYVIFAIISVVLIFAIIGFIRKIKKDKLKGVQTADAVAQPLVADTNAAPVQEEVPQDLLNNTGPAVAMAADTKEEDAIAPSLEGLESNAELDNSNVAVMQAADNTLVLDPNATASAAAMPTNPMNGGEAALPEEAPAEAPMLIIEDPSAKPAEPAPAETPAAPAETPAPAAEPAAPVETPAAPAQPEQPQQ